MPNNDLTRPFIDRIREMEREQARRRARLDDAQVVPADAPQPPPLRYTLPLGNFGNNNVVTAEGAIAPPPPQQAINWDFAPVDDAVEVVKPKKEKKEKPVIEEDPRLKVPEMSTRARRFKPKYENTEEWRLRLNNSIITLYDKIVYVQEVLMGRDTETHQFGLCAITLDAEGHQSYMLLNEHGMNLRAVDPGYVDMPRAGVYYMYRIPARVYKQGNTRDNTRLMVPGTDSSTPWHRDSPVDVLKGLSNRPIVKYDPDKAAGLIATYGKVDKYPAVRLSDALAYYITHPAEHQRGRRIVLEYKGRHLGTIENRTAFIGGCDSEKPWVKKALERVGLAYEVDK